MRIRLLGDALNKYEHSVRSTERSYASDNGSDNPTPKYRLNHRIWLALANEIEVDLESPTT